MLRAQHVEVWYDEFSLQIGDSLRRSIDRGLAESRFGIVILSPSFFRKHWSQWELDGLVARQNSGEQGLILPVWHDVSREEVLAYSPPLADKLAVASSSGLDEVVRRLLAVIRPQGSALVIARNHLVENGFAAPVISDDWWLDVAAFAESNDMEGGFQEPMGWGRWGFPLPSFGKDPSTRGRRMAAAALQMMWQTAATEAPITQITHPDRIHEFIGEHPGLARQCHDHLRYLISYAPQLTIRGFGGQFEDEIEELYSASVEVGELRRARGDRFGTGLTADGRSPGCDDEYALRDPEFGRYGRSHVACGFVQGNYVANGPPVQHYPHIDYAAWLLSDESLWLPSEIRWNLTLGMAEWGVWPWYPGDRRAIDDFGYADADFTGSFADALEDVNDAQDFDPDGLALADLVHRLSFSAKLLGLPEDGESLADRLLQPSFLGHFFVQRVARKKRRSAASRRKE